MEIIERRVRGNPKELGRRLTKLNKLKVIVRETVRGVSYRLTYLGLDCLALNTLVGKDIISHLGSEIGMGKESVIYLAKDSSGRILTIKFYKIGRVSFQKVVKVRSYLVDQHNWLLRSKVAAEREYKALKELANHTPYVPKVFGWNRHAVVMEYVSGIELYRYREALDPEGILAKILHALRAAYLNLGIVHGDLSEYNVLVSIKGSEEHPYIIDWPQYVYKDDPQSKDLLERDVTYVVRFFKRRYGVETPVDRAIAYVKGEVSEF